MEDRKRWVNASFLAVSALVYYICSNFFGFLVAKFDLETRFADADLAASGLAGLIGVSIFVYLLRNVKSQVFMDEVVLELSRVTWPTRQETTKATIVVVIMVLIAGFVVGALDGLWHWALKFVI